MMRNRLVGYAIGGILAGGLALGVHSQTAGPLPENEINAATISQEGEKAIISSTVFNREGTRTIGYYAGTATDESTQVTANREIDARTMVIHNGQRDSSGYMEGLILINNGFQHFFAITERTTESFQFDPPLKLREGDSIDFNIDPATAENVFFKVTFHGTPPASQVMIIK